MSGVPGSKKFQSSNPYDLKEVNKSVQNLRKGKLAGIDGSNQKMPQLLDRKGNHSVIDDSKKALKLKNPI